MKISKTTKIFRSIIDFIIPIFVRSIKAIDSLLPYILPKRIYRALDNWATRFYNDEKQIRNFMMGVKIDAILELEKEAERENWSKEKFLEERKKNEYFCDEMMNEVLTGLKLEEMGKKEGWSKEEVLEKKEKLKEVRVQVKKDVDSAIDDIINKIRMNRQEIILNTIEKFDKGLLKRGDGIVYDQKNFVFYVKDGDYTHNILRNEFADHPEGSDEKINKMISILS